MLQPTLHARCCAQCVEAGEGARWILAFSGLHALVHVVIVHRKDFSRNSSVSPAGSHQWFWTFVTHEAISLANYDIIIAMQTCPSLYIALYHGMQCAAV